MGLGRFRCPLACLGRKAGGRWTILLDAKERPAGGGPQRPPCVLNRLLCGHIGGDSMGIEIPLHRLYRVQSSKLLRTNPDEFYTELVRTVADVCETKLNALYLVDRSGTRLQLKAAIGLPEEWVNASSEIPIGTHMEAAICGRAAALRE